MNEKELDNVKMFAALGTITFIIGISIVFLGYYLMGISSLILGIILAIKGFKLIK
ncbi:hypothetical protein H0I23_06285 [Cellulophaga sp. HaHaR_3_176]|uniref:hypothetical protein n=1 Tax=Cellulophaga sp. HaHaR_3_176 TaxID=1942464 RepID=UPI001C1FD527|nr:hypothetical protein [Cellulophaga sp. HaHaR_3_176]QWX85243.1 hypothetical protein H0I23_06285 [Cellulophaga sp. HaHaR_3_176]